MEQGWAEFTRVHGLPLCLCSEAEVAAGGYHRVCEGMFWPGGGGRLSEWRRLGG